MRIQFALAFLLIAGVANGQQKVIRLYQGKAPGSENWNWKEAASDSNAFNTEVIYNVSDPTLTYFPAQGSVNTGTAVIVAPGGGFHTLSINSEGINVAKWLNAKGVTAFVLKYRLVHNETNDPVKELLPLLNNRKKLDSINAPIIPLAINDGLEAVKYVRAHASEFNIDPKRIGFMGFSAGGAVTAGVTFNYTIESRPDFIAPIYAYTGALKKTEVPKDAPPMFVVAASDDQLGLAPQNVKLYSDWIAAGKISELHMYEKGGHGFGMRKNNIPTDTWIERFGDWLGVNGLLWPEHPSGSLAGTTYQDLKNYEAAQEEARRIDWANKKRYAAENAKLNSPKAGERRVIFIGNSITEGWKQTDSNFFRNHAYINRGISGQTTPQMLLRFRADVIELNPTVVVILAGINDIAQNTGPMTLEETFGNLVSMAELAKANKIKVVLSSILPAYDFPWRPGLKPAEKVVKLNAMIKAYATRNKIVYVDYFTPMVDSRNGLKADYTKDGIHPTLPGYKVMEPLIERGIAEALGRQ